MPLQQALDAGVEILLLRGVEIEIIVSHPRQDVIRLLVGDAQRAAPGQQHERGRDYEAARSEQHCASPVFALD
jgi:hypothetical protein